MQSPQNPLYNSNADCSKRIKLNAIAFDVLLRECFVQTAEGYGLEQLESMARTYMNGDTLVSVILHSKPKDATCFSSASFPIMLGFI